jgi:prepilin-type N-terminal cleavage/methylation domain-containing protein
MWYKSCKNNNWRKKMRYIGKNKRIKGFTMIELVIVLAVLGIILVIALPNVIKYYYQQRFYQEVQHLVALFRTAQFTAISTNHWIGIAMHPVCPYMAGVGFCTQIIRLPRGRCALLANSAYDYENWPNDWASLPNCADNNVGPNQLCEYPDERWVMEKITAPVSQPPINADVVYIIGPDGTVTSQTAGEDNRICSSLPIPMPTLQLVFAYPPETTSAPEHFYKGVCMSGRGNIYTTPPAEEKTDLKCTM